MTPKEAYDKCVKEQKRILELEDLISTNIDYCYYYARDIIKGPWERGEETISKDAYYSYLYVRDIIKESWERGEDAISKNSYYSYYYALYVIRGPFEKCHPIIFNSQYKDEYIKFLKRKKYDLNKISEWLL